MSTGNTNKDERYLVNSAVVGNPPRLIGTNTSRQWNGTNWSKTPPTRVPGYSFLRQRTYTAKNGKVVTKVKTIHRRPKKVFVKPPKRALIEEHPYTSGFQRNITGLVRRLNGQDYASDGDLSISTITIPWTNNDELKLLDKLRDKVAGSDFNAGVALGESRKSLQLITESATKIAVAIRQVKKFQFSKAAVTLTGSPPPRSARFSPKQTTANNWLQLQYGWLPLLKDAEAGAQFLAHAHSVPSQITVRVSRRVPGSITVVAPTAAKYGRVRVFRRQDVIARIRESSVVGLSGLTDPLSVAWELVPYSFVVDWFIPIGTFLQSRALAQSLQGTFITSTLDIVDASGYTDGGTTPTLLSCSPDASQFIASFSRVVSTSLNVPYPNVKPLGKVASWAHCINAVALLQSRFR